MHHKGCRIRWLERRASALEFLIFELQANLDLLGEKVAGLTIVIDSSGNGANSTTPAVPDLAGLTGASAVLAVSSACAVLGTFVNSNGSSAVVAKFKGVFRAPYGANLPCLVVPVGGKVTVTGLSGTDAVAWAHGDVLFIAPDGTLGTFATLQAHMGWSGVYETKEAGVVSDNGAGVLELTIDPGFGIPI